VAWKPEAEAPQVEKFIGETFPDDAVELAYEIAGYALLSTNPLQRAVLLLGPGDNGKGVYLGLIRALVGDENVSGLSLHEISENRFARAELFGKLVNVHGDLDARSVSRTDVFKVLTGDGRLDAEIKHGAHFHFVPRALPIFSANESPISSDQSHGYFRR